MILTGELKFVHVSRIVRSTEGTSVNLVCEVARIDTPVEFSWKIDNVVLRSDNRYNIMNTLYNTTLRINPVIEGIDSLTFTCVARTDAGEIQADQQLIVSGQYIFVFS